MAIVTLKELRAALPRGKRLLGVDQSKKALGLALSSPDLGLATPLKTLMRTKFTEDIKILAEICREYAIGGFVVGLPVNMDGTEGPRVDSVRHFADNLIGAADVLGFEPPVAFFDERLSTQAAHDLLVEAANVSAKRRAEVIDQLAAQIILQGALDQMARI
ncbi:MAG: Holliday junction resolvase RuvX [Alphaproteobacteria bacterium]|nr:Holliday junction resolvase RuvX [Alphaproteobacteria bacterium]MDE2336781.1 Holliday junction resolvase RuvX [Alphaproteobacteria bacterium]